MAKENCNTPEAKKSLDFGNPRAAATDLHVAETTAKISNSIFASPGIASPIQFAFVPTQIPVQVFIPPNRQNLVQRDFPGLSPRFTSTQLRTAGSQNKMSYTQTNAQETKVRVAVEYPSKTICKELKDDFVSLGKAFVHGSCQRFARAVLKNETLKKFIVEKVLQLMTLQLNDLCSRRKPSLPRVTTKEQLTQFDFQKLISEWKEKAPIFYAFLVTCASSKKENPEWFPSASVAGSILLKQRNSHMNGCVTVLGLLLKTLKV